MTCSEGKWNQSPAELTFEYQWLRETEGTDETIAGATTKEHKVVSADRGHLLYCQVVAKNKASPGSGGVELAGGVKKGPNVPKIWSGSARNMGTLSFGHLLTCGEGTWTNSPTQYVFQWMRERKDHRLRPPPPRMKSGPPMRATGSRAG